ncbi:MAG: helix-turn-helix domain-containing protein [Planctomycetales bacterium]
MKTIDRLIEETDVTVEALAERTGLSAERVEAIAVGRWLPSPNERRRVAEAFQLEVDEISWGHTMPPRNVQAHRFGIKKEFESDAGE